MASRGIDRNCLFIRGFSKDTSETDIRDFFTKNIGRCTVESFRVYFNGWSSNLKLRFYDGADAAKARKLYHQKEVLGCKLTVEWFRRQSLSVFKSYCNRMNDYSHIKKYQLSDGRTMRTRSSVGLNRKSPVDRAKADSENVRGTSRSSRNSAEDKRASAAAERKDSSNDNRTNAEPLPQDPSAQRKILLPTPIAGRLLSPNEKRTGPDWFRDGGPRGRMEHWSPGRGRASRNRSFEDTDQDCFSGPLDDNMCWSTSRSRSGSRKRSLSPGSSLGKSEHRSSRSPRRGYSASSSSSPRHGRSPFSPGPKSQNVVENSMSTSPLDNIPLNSDLDQSAGWQTDSSENPRLRPAGQFTHAVRPSRGRGGFAASGGFSPGLGKGNNNSGKTYVFKSRGGKVYNGNVAFGRGSPGAMWRSGPFTGAGKPGVENTPAVDDESSINQPVFQNFEQNSRSFCRKRNLTVIIPSVIEPVKTTEVKNNKEVSTKSSKINATVERLLKAGKKSLNLTKQRLAENQSRDSQSRESSMSKDSSENEMHVTTEQQELDVTRIKSERSPSRAEESTCSLAANVQVKVEVDPDTFNHCVRESAQDVNVEKETPFSVNLNTDSLEITNAEMIGNTYTSFPADMCGSPDKICDSSYHVPTGYQQPCQPNPSSASSLSGVSETPPSEMFHISASTCSIGEKPIAVHSDTMCVDLPQTRKRKFSQHEEIRDDQETAKMPKITDDRTEGSRGDLKSPKSAELPASSKPGRLEKIRAKKIEVETAFKQDCETFCTVAKLLVSKDPGLEERLQPCLQSCLQDISEAFLTELKQFVADENQQD